MNGLFTVVHRTTLDQLHHAVRKHLRMDAQIVLVLQCQSHSIRYSANPQLQRRTVGNALGNQAADCLAGFIDLCFRQADQGHMIFIKAIDLRNMYHRRIQGSGQILIDFHNNMLCLV